MFPKSFVCEPVKCFQNIDDSDSVPQSPLIEMPSTPASNSLMYIEFPDDADNGISYVNDSNIVEVSTPRRILQKTRRAAAGKY